MRPSEYVARQMRFTPYPTEDVGWIIDQAGPELVLFCTDFPHVEGGRRPVERFESSLDAAGVGDDDRDRFYRTNFVELMGAGLPGPVRWHDQPSRSDGDALEAGRRGWP